MERVVGLVAAALLLAAVLVAGEAVARPVESREARAEVPSVRALSGAGPRFTVRRLPLFEATGINKPGLIIGWQWGRKGGAQPVIWNQGRLTPILTQREDAGMATAINNNDAVVGWHTFGPGEGQNAFVWQHNRIAFPNPLPGTVLLSDARDINNKGDITGTTDTWWDANADEDPSTWPSPRARLWRGGKMIDLGTLGGRSSIARGVNDQDQVIGESMTRTGAWHAFLWQNGKMRDLGTLGGRTSGANGINDSGQVVGYSGTGKGQTHAVLWADGRARDLGTLLGGKNSNARAVNNLGQIVGAGDEADGFGHPILWQQATITDLGVPRGDRFAVANAINEHSQIVGTAGVQSAETHGVLWTPRHP